MAFRAWMTSVGFCCASATALAQGEPVSGLSPSLSWVADEKTVQRAIDAQDVMPQVPQVRDENASVSELRSEALRKIGRVTSIEPPVASDRLSGVPLIPAFVTDEEAAIALGKALFWDEQVGSDGIACATCHFHGGADSRIQNQISPGLLGGDGRFDALLSGGGGPNHRLTSSDFPIAGDDVVSSSGVFGSRFLELWDDQESCEVVGARAGGDPFGFHRSGVNTRRVEPRNAPSVLHAAFQFLHFWDGRGRREYNGKDPFGERSEDAHLLQVTPSGDVEQITVSLENLSAASQAIGPVLSSFEMSCAEKSFAIVARKLLRSVPLAAQRVHTQDSVLGPYVSASGVGLDASYAALIAAAFPRRFWDSDLVFTATGDVIRIGIPSTPNEFSLMELNFSFLWGLAIHLYEQKLNADQTPFDDWLAGDETALTDVERLGLDVFLHDGKCINCHSTPLLSNASTVHLTREHAAGGLVERMPAGTGPHPYRMIGRGRVAESSVELKIDVSADVDRLGTRIASTTVAGDIEVRAGEHCTYRAQSVMLDADGDRGAASATRDVELHALLQREAPPSCPRSIWLRVVDGWRTGTDTVAVYRSGTDQLWFAGNLTEGDVTITGPVLYDNGFYNIGVRPTAEDIGIGNTDPFGNPLSYTRQYVEGLLGRPYPDPFHVDECTFEIPFDPEVDIFFFPGGFEEVPCDGGEVTYRPRDPRAIPDAALREAQTLAIRHLPTAVDGAFKVPGLRNIALTGPYFHNGGHATLEQVVDFYDRGGDFAVENQLELAPDITPLHLSHEQKQALSAFLRALTDQRAACEMAPFDHPALSIPEGHAVDASGALVGDPQGRAIDQWVALPAVGREGRRVESLDCLTEFRERLSP